MQNRQKRQAATSLTQNTTVPSYSHLFLFKRRIFPHSRHVETTIAFLLRMRQFLPGTKTTLHFLQKRPRHCTGIFVLDLAASFRAAVISFLASGCITACSNNAATSLADALGFTSLLQRIKLYKHLVMK